MKGLKLPVKTESKNEKSQIYLENNLNKIKNNLFNIYDKHQRLFKYIANKKKTILTTKYFHLKLMTLIFMINIIHCTII